MNTESRERLLTLIRERALVKAPEGKELRLVSGQLSKFYLDMKMIELFPEGSNLIGQVMFDMIRDLEIDAIGGLAVGAVPMVTSIVDCCFRNGKQIEGFFVRDEAKKHGTMKTIEGNLPENARVVIVDDVVTTGASTKKAIDAAVKERGVTVVAIFSIVDRGAGASELFASLSPEQPYRSVYTLDEVLDEAQAYA